VIQAAIRGGPWSAYGSTEYGAHDEDREHHGKQPPGRAVHKQAAYVLNGVRPPVAARSGQAPSVS
jgi:hypothetical protein